MADQTEQLDRESSLMLYAAGEMPAEQKMQFEAQLASDAALAAELQRVREAMDGTAGDLNSLDARQRPPVSDAVAVRRVERALQQWAVDRLRAPEPQPKRAARMPWWSYPAATAACVIIGFLIWSGRQPVQPVGPDPQARGNFIMGDAEALADRLDEEFEPMELAADASAGGGADELDAFFIHPSEVASW